jgi:hypothetical protein
VASVHTVSVACAVVALVATPFGVLLCLLFPGLLPGVADRVGALMAAIRRRSVSRRGSAPTGTGGPPIAPIAQVAADLRRLNRLRGGVATRSAVWFIAVRDAYDDRLGAACHQLQVDHYLDALAGLDLDIERLRVEDALRHAGLVLDDVSAPNQPGPR